MNESHDSLERQLGKLHPVSPSAAMKELIRSRVERDRQLRRGYWIAATGMLVVIALLMIWPAQRSALAQAFEAAEEAAAKMRTLSATIKTDVGDQRRTFHAWYKKPNRSRDESVDGLVTIDDGTRSVTWDPRSRKVTHDEPSQHLDESVERNFRVAQLQGFRDIFDKLNGRGSVKAEGPKPERIDDHDCSRYDVTFKPEAGERLEPFVAAYWFSKSDSLLRRVVTRTEGKPPVEITVAYDFDVPDDLFVIPADLIPLPPEPAAPPPPELVIAAVDQDERPLAGVRVFFGHTPQFELYRTGADGRVTVPSRPDRLGQHWSRQGEFFVSHFLSNEQVIAESADGKLSDVFTMKFLLLVSGKGMMELDPDAQEWRLGETQLSAGLQQQLRFDPATGRLTLKLRLLPKAALVGRVPAGLLHGGGRMFALPLCQVRPLEQRQPFVACLRLDERDLRPMQPGEQFDLFGTHYYSCKEDGSFRLDVPAGKPFQLFFQPAYMRPPMPPWTHPAKDPDSANAIPLPELAPGEERDLGEIQLPAPGER